MDLLLPEAVRNCILEYACCAVLSTVLNLSIRLCIYENMVIYGGLKVRQTFNFTILQCVDYTLSISYGCMPLDFGLPSGGLVLVFQIIMHLRTLAVST